MIPLFPCCIYIIRDVFLLAIFLYGLLANGIAAFIPDNLITLITALGTLLTSIVGLFTLRQVKKQRETTYQPELCVNDFECSLFNNPFHSSDFTIYALSKLGHRIPKDKGGWQGIVPHAVINNIGLGSAKNVICTWQFDLNAAMERINTLKPDSIICKRNVLCFYITVDNQNIFDIPIKTESFDCNVILPYSKDTEQTLCSIDQTVINAYLLYLLFKHKMYNKETKNYFIEMFEDMPPAFFIIDYDDINNKHFSKKYLVTMHFHCAYMDHTIQCNEKEMGYFSIHFNEVKSQAYKTSIMSRMSVV